MSYKVEVIKGFEDEFEKFVRKLDKSSQARLVRLIDLLEKHGINLGMPYVKKLGKNMGELRTSGKQKVRVIFVSKGLNIVILNWFIKKTNKTPLREMETAQSRLDRI